MSWNNSLHHRCLVFSSACVRGKVILWSVENYPLLSSLTHLLQSVISYISQIDFFNSCQRERLWACCIKHVGLERVVWHSKSRKVANMKVRLLTQNTTCSALWPIEVTVCGDTSVLNSCSDFSQLILIQNYSVQRENVTLQLWGIDTNTWHLLLRSYIIGDLSVTILEMSNFDITFMGISANIMALKIK